MDSADHRSCHGSGRITPDFSRRGFLRRSSTGFGWLAFSSLVSAAPRPSGHFPARAKNVIFCFMDGGPSHVDTFDPKPMLAKHAGEKIGQSNVSVRSQSTANRVWAGSPWTFRQRGKSGLWVSDLLPHIAGVADKITVVRSMVGELPLHGQQNLLLHTGRILGQAPSLGAWSLTAWAPRMRTSRATSSSTTTGSRMAGSRISAVPFSRLPTRPPRSGRREFPWTTSSPPTRRPGNGANSRSSRPRIAPSPRRPPIRIRSKVPSPTTKPPSACRARCPMSPIFPVSRSPSAGSTGSTRKTSTSASTPLRPSGPAASSSPGSASSRSPARASTATTRPGTSTASSKRITRRTPASPTGPWPPSSPTSSSAVSSTRPSSSGRAKWAAPRTPRKSPPPTHGRDHHVDGYSLFMAGGGFRPGTAYGQTDEFGNSVVENRATIHDIHATILRQLGIDHEELTFRHGGRDHSLTDVHGRVIREIVA